MIILYGKYRLGGKRIGYRNDFCLTCESEQIAEQHRTFDLGHLFFIPVLPMGYRNHWHCATCQSNPHDRTRTSKNLIVIFAAVVGLMAVLSWVGPFIPASKDAAMIWSMRFLFLFGFIGLVLWIRQAKPIPGLKERLSSVAPLTGDSCLYCGGGLDRESFCGACKVRRYSVRSTESA